MADKGFGSRSARRRLVVFGDELPSKKAKDLGIDLLPISRSDQFVIQDGSAIGHVIYVPHPAKVDVLVPFADYDEQVARDKLHEALRVLNSLGASHIVATETRTNTRESSVRARGPAKFAKGVLNRNRTIQQKVAYEHHGEGGPSVDPRPPQYPREPGFESACDAVLKNHATSIRIEIIRESQFSLDGSIAISLKRAGFTLGGGTIKSELRTFAVNASFGTGSIGAPTHGEAFVPSGSEPDRPTRKWWR